MRLGYQPRVLSRCLETLWLVVLLFFAVNHAQASTSKKTGCAINLYVLDDAAQQWALDNQLNQANTYSLTDPKYLAYLPSGRLPVCPRKGTYLAGTNLMDHTKCSVHGTFQTVKERDAALVMAATKKRLVWPVVSVVLGLFLLSSASRIPEKIRHVLPVPLSIAYTVGYAPYYFILFVTGGHYGDISLLLIIVSILGGVLLCAAGLRSPYRVVRLFQILALGYHGVFLVSAIMHYTFRPL